MRELANSHIHQEVDGNSELKAQLLDTTRSKFSTPAYDYYADAILDAEGGLNDFIVREFEWGPFAMQPVKKIQ